jgi:serine/threonine protein phosphatase PrpC
MTDDSDRFKLKGSIDAYGMSHVGKVREVNEDHFFLAAATKALTVQQTNLDNVHAFDHLKQSEAHLFVVADGVGSIGGGRLASGTAVQALGTYIGRTMGCYYSFDVEGENEFLENLENAVQHAHKTVQREYSSHGKGPATTLTMVALIWPRAYIIHVGDSRAYYLRKGRLRQLTRDQTMGELMIDEGIMTEEQVERSSLGSTLSSAIGAEILPSVGLIDLEWNDVMLLCTDGLTRHVGDDGIAEILQRTPNAKTACEQLVDAALEGGGRDNVTVVVGKMNSAENG